MEASVNEFLKLKEKRKIIVLGDMLELGEDTWYEHHRIAELIQNKPDLKAFLVGDNFKEVTKEMDIHTFSDIHDAIEYFEQNPPVENTILLKGSRLVGLEKLIPYL
jgi:UDP-N-acetylmuramoyl-tripeptide--D-alanyl-D-alanine ligase